MEDIALMVVRRALIVLAFLSIGVTSDEHDDSGDDDHGDDEGYGDKYSDGTVAAVIGPAVYVTFIVLMCVLCGFGSLIGYCWYRCSGRHKDDVQREAANSAFNLSNGTNGSPVWLRSIVPDPALMGHGFHMTSNGLSIVNHDTIMRTRRGRFDTDAARWSMPMTSGKHAFQITWPYPFRGVFASIGLGTVDAPLYGKKTTSLVGGNEHTWGIDLARRRVLHNNKIQAAYPKIPGRNKMAQIPNTFFMFVDMDTGTLSFGSVQEYWGPAVVGFTLNQQALYLMVACTVQGAVVTVTYIGSAPDNKTVHGGAPPSYATLTTSAPAVIGGAMAPEVCGNLPFNYPPPAYSVATAWAGGPSWMEDRPVDRPVMGPHRLVEIATSDTMWSAQTAPPPYQATVSASASAVTMPSSNDNGDELTKY